MGALQPHHHHELSDCLMQVRIAFDFMALEAGLGLVTADRRGDLPIRTSDGAHVAPPSGSD
jgi:hypothetical protein